MDILVISPDSYDRWAFARVDGHRFHFVDAGISHWEASPAFDPIAYLENCRAVIKSEKVGAVVSTHDLGDLIAAVLAKEAGLPGPSPEAVFLCLHKLYGRRAEVDPIRCQLLLLDEPLPELTYPAYLKAPWLKLGLLGFKVTSDDETLAAMELARRELPAWTRQYYPLFARAVDLAKYPLATTDMMLVEEFVDGRQVTVEGWSLDGDIRIWAMTDTNTFAGTRVIDNFSTPSRVDRETAEALREKTIETIRAFGFDGGFFNIEFWLTGGGVRLTEVNGRSAACFGGIYDLALGVDIFAAVADVATGRAPRALPRPGGRVAGQFNVITFDDDLAGNLLDYDAAAAIPEFSAFRPAEERVRPLSEFGVVLGQFEIVGDSYNEIHERADTMRRKLLKTEEHTRISPSENMTPEMRRIVAEAKAAARVGWSDEAVASLAKSTRALHCDASELARLLALPGADHGFREEVFTTGPSFHASVFALAEGETIPLHDHPRMDVISKVLRGRVLVRAYEWLDVKALLARACGELILGESDGALVLRKSPGTLHTITALEGTAFLDLFAPYYDEVARPCSYYKEVAGLPATNVQLRVVTWDEARQ